MKLSNNYTWIILFGIADISLELSGPLLAIFSVQFNRQEYYLIEH